MLAHRDMVVVVRCTNKLGMVHVRIQLIASKNKVAPLKLCTIPHLELQAVVLAVKVDALLKRELDLDFSQSFFWTDSEIILTEQQKKRKSEVLSSFQTVFSVACMYTLGLHTGGATSPHRVHKSLEECLRQVVPLKHQSMFSATVVGCLPAAILRSISSQTCSTGAIWGK